MFHDKINERLAVGLACVAQASRSETLTPKFGSLISLMSIPTFPTVHLPKTRSVLVTCGLFLALDVATSFRIADLMGIIVNTRKQ